MSTFGLTALPGDPFFTGTSASSSDVPGKFPVALDGRGFLLDLKSNEYVHRSIPLLRQQADQSEVPGSGSVNPDDLWRRLATSWDRGAGQRYLDAEEAEAGRYYTSKGIDPWTYGQISLLPDVDEKKSSASSNLGLAVAGGYLYLLDGGSIQYTQDVTVGSPTWSDITGESATNGTSITSDGYSVYSSHAADGIYVTTRGAAATAKGVTGTVDGVKYLKGRLFAWATDKLYNITSVDTGTPAALPTALLDHPNSDFVWVDVAEAAGFYFPAGYSGDKTTIYKTAVQEDGTNLDNLMVAAELPDGEIVRAIYGYLGFLLIGTDKGIRFGSPDSAGNVTLGALITDVPEVRCFEGQESFVWFGWSQYDGTSTGLGRLDLATFNASKPAYASDLMTAENGDVLAVATFQGVRVFAVSGDGIFAEDTAKVASGTIDLGRITYGLADPKVSLSLTVNHEPLAGTIAAYLARDGGDYVEIGGAASDADSVTATFPTNAARGQAFDVRLTLTRDAGDTTLGPTVNLVTLKAFPAAERSERIVLPLLLGTNQRDYAGNTITRNIVDDLEFLRNLESDSTPVTLQEGTITQVVVAEDHEWRPHHRDESADFTGTYLIQLKRFASE